ncbi:MAG TPA: hypothetical protein VK835_02845 [Bacteroidia bacterium]|nr:hypothetical protein [Bacteroidia bacterium]
MASTSFVLYNKSSFTILSKEDAAALLQQVNHKYSSSTSYSFAITHATYAGYDAVNPYEKKAGYFKKFPAGFHSNIAGVHSIQNKNCLLTIDSAQKIIIVSNPKKGADSWELQTKEYLKSLGKCNAIKIEQGDKTKTLRLEFDKRNPVSAYELCINKNNEFQSTLIFYAREIVAKKLSGKKVKPKLSMVFDHYAWKVVPEKDELSETRFITINSSNTLTLKEAYKNFTLLDHRIKNEKP